MITISRYRRRSVLILGLSKTGISLIMSLLEDGATTIYIHDDNQQKLDNIINSSTNIESMIIAHHLARDNGLIKLWCPENLQSTNPINLAAIIPSPGIPLNQHPIIQWAKEQGIEIASDIELLLDATRKSTHIGITGTNGKSTTCALIHHLLQSMNYSSVLGGNIGIPALSLPYYGKETVYVLELSSFQLELLALSSSRKAIDIAVLLNISDDHLNRYKDMADYVTAKRQIFVQQDSKSIAIVGIDDEISSGVYNDMQQDPSSDLGFGRVGDLMPISAEKHLAAGVSVLDNILYYKDKKYELTLPLSLKGKHNAQNIAAAVASVLGLGAKIEDVVGHLQDFKGLPHRNQVVHEDKERNIVIINDSKATNTAAGLGSISAYDNILLIAGGIQKDDKFSEIIQHKDKLKKVYLIGQCAENYAKSLKSHSIEHTIAGDLLTACDEIKKELSKKQAAEPITVLLAPCAASLDQFENFEQRGELFVKYMKPGA